MKGSSRAEYRKTLLRAAIGRTGALERGIGLTPATFGSSRAAAEVWLRPSFARVSVRANCSGWPGDGRFPSARMTTVDFSERLLGVDWPLRAVDRHGQLWSPPELLRNPAASRKKPGERGIREAGAGRAATIGRPRARHRRALWVAGCRRAFPSHEGQQHAWCRFPPLPSRRSGRGRQRARRPIGAIRWRRCATSRRSAPRRRAAHRACPAR